MLFRSSPLGLTEYLINQGRVYPLYYCWVGPKAPLGHLQVVLYAIVVVYI